MTGELTLDPERAGTATTVERSALDRRREKLQANKAAARAAIDAVADLDARIDHNSSQTREYEAALQAALDQIAALKKAKGRTRVGPEGRAARSSRGPAARGRGRGLV